MAILKYYKDGEWQKVNAPINEGVTSVNGQTGDVIIDTGADIPISDTEPANAETGDLWLDTSAETYSKQYIIAPENPEKGQTLVYNGSTWVARDDKMTITLSVTVNEQGAITDFESSSHTFGQIKAALDEGINVILKMISSNGSDNTQQFGYLYAIGTLTIGFMFGMADVQFHSDNTITSQILGIQ